MHIEFKTEIDALATALKGGGGIGANVNETPRIKNKWQFSVFSFLPRIPSICFSVEWTNIDKTEINVCKHKCSDEG